MNPFPSLVQGFVAPGRVGRDLDRAGRVPAGAVASTVLVLLVLPALGLGWVVSYVLMNPSNFLLSYLYNEPYTGLIIPFFPVVLCLALAGILAMLAWFLPTTIIFASNGILAARNGTMPPRAYGTTLLATMPSFGIHLGFLALSFWLMTSGNSFFWGMRTVEDSAFTIALVVSLVWSLAGMTIAVKNVFGHGAGPSLVGITIYAGLLVVVFVMLFS